VSERLKERDWKSRKRATVSGVRIPPSPLDNQSDVPGAVLQRNNIHIKTCQDGQVSATLSALRTSPATAKQKAKFILATDGKELLAENLAEDVPPLACEYWQLPDHFGFFLPLAGITTVRQISENAFDIRATGRLNRLYVELRRQNPDWDNRREDLNHFFARLIFCFFAEDTGIFDAPPTWGSNPHFGLFSWAIETMTEPSGGNVHEVLSKFFQAMNTPLKDRAQADLPALACKFPYVNGNLFSGSTETPKFSKIARSYLLFIGGLDWKLINPDIFGSMIQAVAEDEERGALGMHYTSVPNILKVLNPLFLDDLRQKLAEAGDGSTPASKGQLKRLRDRLARIRVFDPACGSGNFLVIAYKEMRQIEAVINERRGERDLPSAIPMTNFRGIELRGFAAEIARLALIIAKFQCDVLHINQRFACEKLLPLEKGNWITCDNALRVDWLDLMDARGTGVKMTGDDLFKTPLDQAEIDFENRGGETYICGNPPYLGSVVQTSSHKDDLKAVFGDRTREWKSLDYVAGWFYKAAHFGLATTATSAFVATNSLCQGEQVPILWPLIFELGYHISFARRSFKWSNLASHNAGVTVVVVGISKDTPQRRLFDTDAEGKESVRVVDNIGPYLVAGPNHAVDPISSVPDDRSKMIRGNMPNDGGHLVLTSAEAEDIVDKAPCAKPFIRNFVGSQEFIHSTPKHCIWIDDSTLTQAMECLPIRERINKVRAARLKGGKQARDNADTPHRFVFAPHQSGRAIVVPRVSSELRDYLPVGVSDGHSVISERNFVLYDAPLWQLPLIASRLHWVWIGTVCVRLEMRFSYSNTLGWNTFPVPPLSDQNKADLTRCAEEILLAREAHFPATIADLYDPETMPPDLKATHDRNDETLERIYIGRRFKNDTERLEVLFDLYTKMVAKQPPAKGPRKAAKK
jgi:hypothetical protein